MAKPKRARANPALQLALIRKWHVYISVFVAPTLLFFALTGALQTFRIPDLKSAPVLIQQLARVHKDDVFAANPPQAKRVATGHGGLAADKAPETKPQPKRSTQILKWFFVAFSAAVATTTLLGLWMALVHGRQKAVIWMLFLAGAAAPVLILVL